MRRIFAILALALFISVPLAEAVHANGPTDGQMTRGVTTMPYGDILD